LVEAGEKSGEQTNWIERFTAENTARVERQKRTPIKVVIGNPPYNAWQVNENDNNKNRKYKVISKRVAETYAKDSEATNKSALSDPYVKAFRWASDRIGEEGIVAFISNNSFLESLAFDGMRKHLEQDFDEIYVLDLGGNVRKNPKLSGTTHNVFGIQVGVSINVFARRTKSPTHRKRATRIHYARLDEFWRKEAKYIFLEEKEQIGNIDWQELRPDAQSNWLSSRRPPEFEAFIPIGSKEGKTKKTRDVESIFKLYSYGNDSGRDSWVYNFDREQVAITAKLFADTYNSEVERWQKAGKPANVDSFVIYDDKRVKWTRNAKRDLKRGRLAVFSPNQIKPALYRPFTLQYLHTGKIFNKEVGLLPLMLPSTAIGENKLICISGIGGSSQSQALMVAVLPCSDSLGRTQCFPLYTYNEDGTNRRENITDWALEQFRSHYKDESISKWSIFHYVYALLHHPVYRERYAANLKRELPRISYAPDFKAFAEIGKRLAEIHVGYEQQTEYPLERIETPGVPLDWRVEKMKLSKDKSSLIYNDFLTLTGIPPEVFEYRLGNRSALDWIIDQYQVSTDKQSGITNDPNRADDPEYIVRLIGQVVTVSLETVKFVKTLSELSSSHF